MKLVLQLGSGKVQVRQPTPMDTSGKLTLAVLATQSRSLLKTLRKNVYRRS